MQGFVALLLVLLLLALLRLRLLRREMRSMARGIREIHGSHTNRQLRVHSQDRDVAELANAVNALYDDLHAERRENALAIEEMRANMANISHDLRTPLTSVLGYLKLLQRRDNTAEQQGRYLAVAYDKACSLGELVEGLFLLARLEAGAHRMQMECIDAAQLLTEELAGFYGELSSGEEPRIALAGRPLPIRADRLALSRVFANLLQNIVKHGADGVQITAEEQDGQAVFRFANRAPALAEGDAQELFRRFYTGDRARSGNNTGLGLAIVRELVEGMQGAAGAHVAGGLLTITLRWDICPAQPPLGKREGADAGQ